MSGSVDQAQLSMEREMEMDQILCQEGEHTATRHRESSTLLLCFFASRI